MRVPTKHGRSCRCGCSPVTGVYVLVVVLVAVLLVWLVCRRGGGGGGGGGVGATSCQAVGEVREGVWRFRAEKFSVNQSWLGSHV